MGLALPLRDTAGLSLGELLSGSATAADSAFCFMAWSSSTSLSLSVRKAARDYRGGIAPLLSGQRSRSVAQAAADRRESFRTRHEAMGTGWL